MNNSIISSSSRENFVADDNHVEGVNTARQHEQQSLQSPQQLPSQHDATSTVATSPTSTSSPRQQQLQQRSRYVLGMMRGIFSSSFSLRGGRSNSQSRRNLEATNVSTTDTSFSQHNTTQTGINASDGDGDEMFHSPLTSTPITTSRARNQHNQQLDSFNIMSHSHQDQNDQSDEVAIRMMMNGNHIGIRTSDDEPATPAAVVASPLRDDPKPRQRPLTEEDVQFYTPREECHHRANALDTDPQPPEPSLSTPPTLLLTPLRRDFAEEDPQNDAPGAEQEPILLPRPPPEPEQQLRQEPLQFSPTYIDDFDIIPTSSYYDSFYPDVSINYEHMGRSIESLLLSHSVARAPILLLPPESIDSTTDDLSSSNHTNHVTDHLSYHRRGSTGGSSSYHHNLSLSFLPCPSQQPQRRRHSSLDSFTGHIRSSISSTIPLGTNLRRGGTLANYNRPRHRRVSMSSSHIVSRRRSSSAAYSINSASAASFSTHQRRNSTLGVPVDDIIPNYINHHDHQPRNGSVPSINHFHQQPRFSNSTIPHHHRHRSSNIPVTRINTSDDIDHDSRGPNILLNLLARESTGKSVYPRSTMTSSSYNELQKLEYMTGVGFINKYINAPSRGMVTEIQLLSNMIDNGDWNETYRCINRLETRLMSNSDAQTPSASDRQNQPQDPTLPQNVHRYYAGGGRNGYDRDIFTLCGGVQVLLRIFHEKAFVGQEMADSYDARDLTTNIVTTRLTPCWIDVLTMLRELIIYIPSLVDGTGLVDDFNFLPFLITLLAHDSLFDAAATLIEEILSIMSQTQQSPHPDESSTSQSSQRLPETMPFPPKLSKPTMTFFLGNVSDLYKLWRGFNCRQLAHFCRILAFLIFEPEDRQLLESPAVLKSIELLQLRRNRTVRSGYDSTVDMNQSILLGDEVIIRRLLALLRTMNYAPSMSRLAHCNGMTLFPLVADTLFMVGLNELESWSEIERQDTLARTMLHETSQVDDDDPNSVVRVCDLGAVSDMLETFMDTVSRNERRVPPTPVSHVIQVLSAAQQAGVIVGRNRPDRRPRRRTNNDNHGHRSASENEVSIISSETPVDDSTVQGLESAAGILTEQVFIRRFFSLNAADDTNVDPHPGHRHMINTPEDAANSLQFNAMLLSPFHVEVLFVLCTLLGGRRKLDAQDMMNRLSIVHVMDDMIQRLPWSDTNSTDQSTSSLNGTIASVQDPSNHSGIHGPGCECTLENALCIQYLRLLHNFCDRDFENYHGRQQLLSRDEREFISNIASVAGQAPRCHNERRNGSEMPRKWSTKDLPPMKYGLLRKIIDAFIGESDESSYRFWLASCIEAFLRGSSMAEQMFVALAGLMDHLIKEICGNRLHCAGSLQTSFDLLGEIGKGNDAVIELMISSLDETLLQKLISVASTNLVDSNVFLRSMLIGAERTAAMRNGTIAHHVDISKSKVDHISFTGEYGLYQGPIAGSYLIHSWWDTPIIPLRAIDGSSNENECDEKISNVLDFVDPTPTDWFPSLDLVHYCHTKGALPDCFSDGKGLTKRKRIGWILTPPELEDEEIFVPGNASLSTNSWKGSAPISIDRLHWFLYTNQTQLLYDLLSVVNLRNINHENICCLNTAIVVTIFAYRRNELYQMIHALRTMNDSASVNHQHDGWKQRFGSNDTAATNELVQGMRSLSIMNETLNGSTSDDHNNILINFRQVLWFWVEYYTHRGRDRLSLEYSSHLRYDDWISVVTTLLSYFDDILLKKENDGNIITDVSSSSLLFITADHASSIIKKSSPTTSVPQSSTGSARSLLPRSPYQRAAHVVVGSDFLALRGE